MAVYSRYAKVAEPDGSVMRVRTALELINQVLDEVVAEQEGDLDRDSRWCVKWFTQLGWETGRYGDAETLATALNTSVKGLERAGVVRQAAGKVSLIKPEDLPATYDPAKDERPTVWEAVMHMSRRLEEQGVEPAAGFMAAARQIIDLDAAKELAYLLYNICERKRWAAHALRFNSLVTSWPDLVAAARSATLELGNGQLAMDVSIEED
jgi:putative DNA methylase